ncbi:MAG: GxxExxY protein [Leptospira sp.]|nr:GxxExxY protein [Leptospira sp.]
MKENEIAKIIVDACYKIHTTLGPGLLESVYEIILIKELTKRGLKVESQINIPIVYEDLKIDNAFRADLIVNGIVIVEIKSVEQTAKVHYKQLLTYLRLSHNKLGLLINFGDNLIKDGITRIVNKLES